MSDIAVVHLDESCLGNGREGENPGGSGGLVEVRGRSRIERRDFYIHSPHTTNNRMALTGAATVLQLLASKGKRMRVLMVSDSEYLVKGMREWVSGWASRGWTRKAGAIENLALWQALVAAVRLHDVQWTWVRGHRGHPKNEYADELSVAAAREQKSSPGAVESGFPAWLAAKKAKGLFPEYDPDTDFETLERRIAAGDTFALADKS
jgi:ribonuclease HI